MKRKSWFGIAASIGLSFGITTAALAYANLTVGGGVGIWQLVSGVISPTVSSNTLGNAATRVAEGWFTTLDTTNFNATTATITGITAGNLLPSSSNTYDIGSTTKTWANIYASGTASTLAGLNWTNATGTNTTSTNLFATNLQFTNATGGFVTGTRFWADNGKSGGPAYTFSASQNTGMYYDSNGLRFDVAGSQPLIIASSAIRPVVNITPWTTGLNLGASSAPFRLSYFDGLMNTVSVSSTGDIYPGFSNNTFNLGTPSSSWANIYASGTAILVTVSSTQQTTDATSSAWYFAAGDGAQGKPSFTFTADTDTGWYRAGANAINITTGADSAMQWGTSLTRSYRDIVGNVNNTYSLGSFGNAWRNLYASSTAFMMSGIFSGRAEPGQNNVFDLGTATNSWANIYASGTANLGSVTTTMVTSSRIFLDKGNAGAPALAFSAQQNGGIYLSSDGLFLRIGGTDNLILSGSAVRPNLNIVPFNTGLTLGAAGAPFSNMWLDGLAHVRSVSTTGDVFPGFSNNTFNLGTPSSSWANIYASGTASLLAVSSTAVTSTAFYAGNGSLNNLGYTFSGDTDSGFFISSANTIDIVAAGGLRLRVGTGGILANTTVAPLTDASINLGSQTLRWLNSHTINSSSTNLTFSDASGTTLMITNSSTFNNVSYISATGSVVFVSQTARFPSDTKINNTSICLADGTNCSSGSGSVASGHATGTAGIAINPGDALYISTTGTLFKTDTSAASSTYPFIGISDGGYAVGATVTYSVQGQTSCTLAGGLSSGYDYFLNGAGLRAGAIATTGTLTNLTFASSTIVRVGRAISSSCLAIKESKVVSSGNTTINAVGERWVETGFYPARIEIKSFSLTNQTGFSIGDGWNDTYYYATSGASLSGFDRSLGNAWRVTDSSGGAWSNGAVVTSTPTGFMLHNYFLTGGERTNISWTAWSE